MLYAAVRPIGTNEVLSPFETRMLVLPCLLLATFGHVGFLVIYSIRCHDIQFVPVEFASQSFIPWTYFTCLGWIDVSYEEFWQFKRLACHAC